MGYDFINTEIENICSTSSHNAVDFMTDDFSNQGINIVVTIIYELKKISVISDITLLKALFYTSFHLKVRLTSFTISKTVYISLRTRNLSHIRDNPTMAILFLFQIVVQYILNKPF